MTVLFLILRTAGIILAALLVLAIIVLLLPAGLKIHWQYGGQLELWLMIGPVRRRLFLPEEQDNPGKETAKETGAPKAEASGGTDAARQKTGASPAGENPPPAGNARQSEEKQTAPPPAAAQPQEDEIDRLMRRLAADPISYARRLQHWAKGPGRFLLDRLNVRHVRIIWTVTESDAAATAVTYGAMIAAFNTAWAVLQDLVDVKADELRVEPDFTGERSAERCFTCQITAKLYIIIASFLLTINASAKRRFLRGCAGQRRQEMAAPRRKRPNKSVQTARRTTRFPGSARRS